MRILDSSEYKRLLAERGDAGPMMSVDGLRLEVAVEAIYEMVVELRSRIRRLGERDGEGDRGRL